MALTDGTLSAADVAAVVGNNNGNGFGFNGDNGAWFLLILFLFAGMNGGWGNGFGGGGAMPYMMGQATQADMQRGFDQQGIMSGIAGINNSLASGFADAAVARCNAQTATLQALSNNQMGLYQTLNGNHSDILQTLNANQNAQTANANQLAMALQQCCCDNRAGLADLKYTVATEACADRQAVNDGLRDVIANNTANTNAIIQSQQQGFQGIQDKLCQLELDRWKQQVLDEQRENSNLRNQINMLNLDRSQTAQTAQLIADNNAQTAALINRIAPAPIPSYQVPSRYGNNCCQPNIGCCA